MVIDNDIYDRMGATWWDEGNPLNMLHGSCTPGRMSYFRSVLETRLDENVSGLKALDIGCGCGFLAEEFARAGFDVVGVDPSPVAVEAGQRHAAGQKLSIDYQVAAGESLPFAADGFDVAYCCDVLEHVSDLDEVIAETARVLKTGGIYLFDTVNRTLASKILGIKVMQEWRWTRITASPAHEWSMFIKPEELSRSLEEHGLQLIELVGLAPKANPLRIIGSFAQAKRGRITYGELSRRLKFGQVKNLSVSYMGYAFKR